ncbi:MAG: hypothetical protein IH989_02290 [Planctomycetes bacterium]|nr:hypothetical protein [Planctomycetota bacterium]
MARSNTRRIHRIRLTLRSKGMTVRRVHPEPNAFVKVAGVAKRAQGVMACR